MDVTKIVQKKLEEKQHEYYDKYIRIFRVAIAFLKKKQVLLYGGLALDQYMPSNLKIYAKTMLPDIDMFTPHPKSLADDLAEYLKKKGYKETTQVTTALHAGTYKVFSEGLPIADVSYIPQDAFDMLSKGVKKSSFGLKLVPPQYLRFTLHTMLALSSVERWEKVVDRMHKFYKVFPPSPVKKFPQVELAALDASLEAINTAVHAYVEDSKAVLLGTPVIDLLLAQRTPVTAIPDVPYTVALVSENPQTYAKKLVSELPYALAVSGLHESKEYNYQTRHVTIKYKGRIVALFYEAADKCFGYNEYKGRRVATIHTVMMMYLGMLLSTERHFIDMNVRGNLDAIVNALAKQTTGKAKGLRSKLNPYALQCIGDDLGLATMRRQRFQKN